ncbi:MAG: tyrosine-type recombinase/integrase [Rubripirellula sp.]
MASIYRRERLEPVPADAVITTTVQSIPAKTKFTVADGIANWVDGDGILRSAPLHDDGKRVVVKTATWKPERGKPRTAPLTIDGTNIIRIGRTYHAKFLNQRGKPVQRSTGTADSREATRIANKWESDEQLRRSGVIDIRVEQASKQGGRCIEEVLTSYIAFLATKNGNAKHRSQTEKYIREFIVAGEWKTIGDIEADSVTRHAERLLASKMAPRTVNSRLTAAKGFTRWLVPDKWHCDPLAGVRKPNPDTDRRIERRALLPSEWKWLRDATESGPERLALSADDRVTLYMLALETGLRVGEISTLTRGKLSLFDSLPYVRCKAAGTKNKKPAKQYIGDELAGRLVELSKMKTKAAKLFEFEDQYYVADMLRADLNQARLNWIRSTRDPEEVLRRTDDDFLLATNAEGEVLDFHALRHTCGAWAAAAGVHPKQIQTLMRHGTITLTMDRYGHLFPGQDSEAVQSIAAVMRGEIDVSSRLTDTKPRSMAS